MSRDIKDERASESFVQFVFPSAYQLGLQLRKRMDMHQIVEAIWQAQREQASE